MTRSDRPTPRFGLRHRVGLSALCASLLISALMAVGALSTARGAATSVPSAAAVAPCLPASLPLAPYTDASGTTLSSDAPTCPIAGSSRLADIGLHTPYLIQNTKGSPSNPVVPAPRVRILLPGDYFTATDKHYPVLFLLHGGGGSYVDWTGVSTGLGGASKTGDATAIVAGDAASSNGVIVVMPTGGGISQYTDWYSATSRGLSSPRYESHIIDQLVPWVDRNFRTWNSPSLPADRRAGRQGRAIAGLSMGGSGAIVLAERHPTLFGTVASFSGSLDAEDTGYGPFLRVTNGRIIDLYMGLIDHEGDPTNVYGPTWNPWTGQGSGPLWDAHDAPKLIGSLAGMDVTNFFGANDVTAPRSSRRHCEQTTWDPRLTGLAIIESAVCVVDDRFDTDIRTSGVPLAGYWFQEFPGHLHDFTAWNEYLRDWLPHAMSVLTPAG